MVGKKFISPGAWFSMIYPSEWNEYEDMEGSFLFYNPNNWTGNFRISAFKKEPSLPDAFRYGKESVKNELANNSAARSIKIGNLECAYSKEMFEEEGNYFVSHIWITGIDNIAFECSFTVPRGGDTQEAEKVISSLEVRNENTKYPPEIIPVRVSEIVSIDESYDWTVSTVKKQLKKDFRGVEEDLPNLQAIIDSGMFTRKQKNAWIALGITLCIIIANEVEGIEWMTLIDGNREAPVLKYKDSDTIIDPMRLVWSKIKSGELCNVIDEYKNVLASL